MSRPLTFLAVLILTVLSVPSPAAAQDDEPKFRDKTLSEWLVMLEGTREAGQRRLALHALGAGADHTLVWRQLTNNRRAALLVVEVAYGPAKSKKVLPALITALRNDPEESIRAGAAQALGRISGK